MLITAWNLARSRPKDLHGAELTARQAVDLVHKYRPVRLSNEKGRASQGGTISFAGVNDKGTIARQKLFLSGQFANKEGPEDAAEMGAVCL
jgi:hypothetical protein